MTEFKVGQTYKTSSNIIVTVTAVGEERLLAKYENGSECVAYKNNARELWTEYVKPIEVGSKVYSNLPNHENHLCTVIAIDEEYAWVRVNGSKGGAIQKLSSLKVL